MLSCKLYCCTLHVYLLLAVCRPIVSLPVRRWFPDYYDDIANPISMTQIKRKIKKRKYNSLNEMATDLNLMFENAKEYNADESKIFQVSREWWIHWLAFSCEIELFTGVMRRLNVYSK